VSAPTNTLPAEAEAVSAGATNLPPMSVPVGQVPAARALPAPVTGVGIARRPAWLTAQLHGARLLVWLACLAVLLAAISLLVPSTPSYDPWAWLIWGREIVHLNLHTALGPSWKPLPVIFTTAFAPFGSAQPDLWLVVARAGALMAVTMAFRLAFRLTRSLVADVARKPAGRLGGTLPALIAGVIAGGSLLLSWGFITENALGYSEGLAVALVLIAVERAMDGAPRQAFVAAFVAALDRPELWLVWVPFGIYLYAKQPRSRRLVIGLFVLIPALWLLPELWGSGHLLRGVTRAHQPRPDSAAFASCPMCTVLQKEAWPALLNRVKVPGLLALLAGTFALLDARRRRHVSGDLGWLVAIAGFGWVWWVGIALETQAGFSGNNRYLELGTAAVAVSGGVAWGWLAGGVDRAMRRLREVTRLLRRRVQAVPLGALVATAAFLAVPPWIGTYIAGVRYMGRGLNYQAELREDLATAVRRAGGARALLSCGSVMTEPFQVPMVAWALRVRTSRVEPPSPRLQGSPWPGVVLQTRAHPNSALLPAPGQIATWNRAGARYVRLAHTDTFTVFRSARC
jgi:hypothetical protein